MNGDRANFSLIVRMPKSLAERVDGLAARAGLSRSQLVRLVLANLTEHDLPSAMIANAEALRPNGGGR